MINQRKTMGLPEKIIGLLQQAFWPHDRFFGVVRHQLVAAIGIGPESLCGFIEVPMQTQYCLRRQIIKQGRRLFKKQRQIPLYTATGRAFAHIFINFGALRIAFKVFPELATEACNRRLIHRELACRQHADFWHGIDAALSVDIKGAYGLDLVIEQVYAIWKRTAHRIQIDQAAPHAKFTRPHDLTDMVIPRLRTLIA